MSTHNMFSWIYKKNTSAFQLKIKCLIWSYTVWKCTINFNKYPQYLLSLDVRKYLYRYYSTGQAKQDVGIQINIFLISP